MKITVLKYKIVLAVCGTLIFVRVLLPFSSASAQPVLFDFDNVAQYTPLPITITVSGITANLSATGSNYSVQAANVLGFTPPGFAGNILYPNSINLTDILIHFNQTLTSFSIMYACNELGCNDASTMRVTTYLNGSFVGTNTKVAGNPGTWPVDTLSCSFTQGFDSVVVHYDSPPPTCQDWGPNFLADNMWVTPSIPFGISNQNIFVDELKITNPNSQSATISFSLLQSIKINASVFDLTGRLIKNIFDGCLNKGEHKLIWETVAISGGAYFLKLTSENFSRSCKLVLVK